MIIYDAGAIRKFLFGGHHNAYFNFGKGQVPPNDLKSWCLLYIISGLRFLTHIEMASYVIIIYLLTLVVFNFATSVINEPDAARYEPNWDSLDSRPLPPWYDKAKIGIFIHWGVFSVPSFGSEWFWSLWKDQKNQKYIDFMNHNYPERFTYQEFAKDFTAEFFNANEWADLFKKSGAKYVVLTSKHHEGFTLWPSKYSYSWNSVDVGPHRDIIAELSQAVRDKDLIFGTYHSLLEWNHPVYQADRASGFTTQEFVFNKILPEMKELVEKYKPDVLWSDGDWESTSEYWNSTDFLSWLYNESPVKDTVVTNDRWGTDANCKHGDFLSCQDRYNPGTVQPQKWENAMTIDVASWGFRREAKLSEYYSALDLISQIASTVSCGGNILINVGPTKDGMISPIFEERLLQIGEWLAINGEAIYETTPWTAQNDTLTWGVWYTSKGTTVYAIVLHWTWYANTLPLSSVMGLFTDRNTKVTMLGNEDDGNLEWYLSDAVYIRFPDKSTVASEWAWVLKIEPNSANNNV